MHSNGDSVEHSAGGFLVLDFTIFQREHPPDLAKLLCSTRKPCVRVHPVSYIANDISG